MTTNSNESEDTEDTGDTGDTEAQQEAREESEARNPDLHGQAREVEEGGPEGEARTPGA